MTGRFVFAVVCFLALSACGGGTKYVPKPEFFEKPEFVAPSVPAVDLAPLEWEVESPERFYLSKEDFKKLLGNEKKMRDTVLKQEGVIKALKEYYKPHDEEASP
jgi:hypothetical protein